MFFFTLKKCLMLILVLKLFNLAHISILLVPCWLGPYGKYILLKISNLNNTRCLNVILSWLCWIIHFEQDYPLEVIWLNLLLNSWKKSPRHVAVRTRLKRIRRFSNICLQGNFPISQRHYSMPCAVWQVFTYLIISTNSPPDHAKSAAAFPRADKRTFNWTWNGSTQQQLAFSRPWPSEKREVKRQVSFAILSWKWEIDGKGCLFCCHREFSRMNTHIIITTQLIKPKSSWKVVSPVNSEGNLPWHLATRPALRGPLSTMYIPSARACQHRMSL